MSMGIYDPKLAKHIQWAGPLSGEPVHGGWVVLGTIKRIPKSGE